MYQLEWEVSALEQGLTPSTTIEDTPIAIDLGDSLGVYRPRNYSEKFFGPTTLRTALEKSRNVVTVRLVHETLGLDKVAEISQRFGLYENLPLQLSMALGAGETTLSKMITAYAMLVNGGRKVTPTLVDRVQDRHGKTVHLGYVRPCHGCSVQTWSEQKPPTLIDTRPYIIDPVHAYQMVSILEGSVKRGTGRRARSIGKPVAGKTGTTNDFKDVGSCIN